MSDLSDATPCNGSKCFIHKILWNEGEETTECYEMVYKLKSNLRTYISQYFVTLLQLDVFILLHSGI